MLFSKMTVNMISSWNYKSGWQGVRLEHQETVLADQVKTTSVLQALAAEWNMGKAGYPGQYALQVNIISY